jgi:release factor glutamine methyltransferase
VPEMQVVSRQSSVVSTAHGTAHEVLADLAMLLREADDVDDAARESLEILSLLWERTPGRIGAHRHAVVPVCGRGAARAAARRRAQGAPLAYATGRAAFRQQVLDVDERVLIPRPETEVVVEEVLRRQRTGVAIDVGTGSGAIALSLASEGEFQRVFATDISTEALVVARRNATRLDLRGVVEFRAGSLLDPVRDVRADVIVANPPYIATSEMQELPAAVRDWEPPLALDAGVDGLAHSRALAQDAWRLLSPGGWLILEADCRRARQIAGWLSSHGAYDEVVVRQDLAGRDRVVVARHRSESLSQTSY